MPQTIEAINHTKAAGVPMIVAITKSDKPEFNPQKIRERLLEHEIIVEEMSAMCRMWKCRPRPARAWTS
jgi:translation initiation factor IF-2